MGLITTILAIAAAAIFFNKNIPWALALVVLAGLVQIVTNNAMKAQVLSNLEIGMDAHYAIEAVSDGLTWVNLILCFSIWGLFVYSLLELI